MSAFSVEGPSMWMVRYIRPAGDPACGPGVRKVYVRLPGKGNSNSHGARPVHLIITMLKWIRTSKLSIKKSLSGGDLEGSAYEVAEARNASSSSSLYYSQA